MRARLLAWGAAAWILAACGSAGQAPLVARDLRIVEPRPGAATGAAYLTLANPGTDALTITAVTSPQFEAVDLHESRVENGVARMRPLPSVVLAGGATERFEPGGRHLMLRGRRGNAGPVTLQFWSGDTLLLAVDVPPGNGD